MSMNTLSDMPSGCYEIEETDVPAPYLLDTNNRKEGLIVEKYDKVTKQPLAGAQFKIVTTSGELVPDNEGLTSSNGLYTTDLNGQIVLSKLLPGTYIVSEERAPDNYRKDPTPQTVVVNAGDTQTIRFYDDPLCTLGVITSIATTPCSTSQITGRCSISSPGADILSVSPSWWRRVL